MGRPLQSASIVVSFLLLLFTSAVADTVTEEELSLEVSQDSVTVADSGAFSDSIMHKGSLDLTFYLNDFHGAITYGLYKQTARSKVWQDFTYTVDYDTLTLNRQQHITFDGKALWGDKIRFGVEWRPLLYENGFVDQDSGYGVASLALGPVIEGTLLRIPFSASGGYTFDVWNENLAKNWLETSMQATSFDDGGYFIFKAGSPTEPLIKKSGLYGNGAINGRYMKGLANSKVTRGDVTLAYRTNNILKSDSITLTFIDTLIHGRVETPYEHKSSYLEQSVRVDNIASLGLTIASLGDGFIEPTFSFYWLQNQYRYPFSSDNSSRRDREFAGAVSYEKMLNKKVTLAGEFALAVGDEDHLFEKDDEEIVASGDIGDKTSNLDDAELFKPFVSQSVRFDNGSRFVVEYAFSIERDRKRHPFYYTSFSDTVRSSSDYDKQNMAHSALFSFRVRPRLTMVLLGDYTRELSYYLSPRASKSSFSRQRYKLETSSLFQIDSLSSLKGAVGAYVEPKEFLFKQSTHSRNFYTRIDGVQQFHPRFKLLYSLEGRLYDRGDWFAETGSYGVNRKSREVAVQSQGGFFLFPPNPGRKHIMAMQLTGGFEGAFERARDWDFNTKQFDLGTNLFKMSPISGFTILFVKGVTIKASLKRYFDKVVDIELYENDKKSDLPKNERYTGDLQKYWDLSLSLVYGG